MHVFYSSIDFKAEYILLKIVKDETKDLSVAPQDLEIGDKIKSNDLELSFEGNKPGSSWISFKLTDLKSNQVEIFDFSLKYYESYERDPPT